MSYEILFYESVRLLSHYNLPAAINLLSQATNCKDIVLEGADGKVLPYHCYQQDEKLILQEKPESRQGFDLSGGIAEINSKARYLGKLFDVNIWSQNETPEIEGFSLRKLPGNL